MEAHIIKAFEKRIKVSDKSIFRVEERKLPRGAYDGLYAHKDIHKAIAYFQNTSVKAGWLVRLIKDGDEYMLITKKQ
jgi:hypothetical protein